MTKESAAIEISRPSGAIATYSPDQMELIKRTVAKGATEDELKLYFYDCQRRNVHPLDRLIVFTARTDNGERRYTPVVTVDYLRSRAADTGEYAGNDDPIYEYTEGAKNPQSAKVTIWKMVQGQKCAFTATARWAEYYPGDKMGFMWRAKPHVMLGKCAEALALRKAFPQQLAGLFAEEELDRHDENVEPPSRPKAEELAASGYISEEERRKLFRAAAHANISTEDLKRYLSDTHNVESTAKLTREVADEAMRWVEGIRDAEKQNA